jgi:glutathione S-transferase
VARVPGGFLSLTHTPPEQRDPDAIQLSLRNTGEVLSILDSHLNCTDYVAGESPTMGDVALGSTVYRWLNIDIERPPMPKLEAWHERLTSRRAYQKSVMVPFTLT